MAKNNVYELPTEFLQLINIVLLHFLYFCFKICTPIMLMQNLYNKDNFVIIQG